VTYAAWWADVPTIHLGPKASALEHKQPGSSDRGGVNREIERDNAHRRPPPRGFGATDATIRSRQETSLCGQNSKKSNQHQPYIAAQIVQMHDKFTIPRR